MLPMKMKLMKVHVHVCLDYLVCSLCFIPFTDLSVSHLQLLLLVWHNFSDDTRKNLLLKCVSSVNRVAEERE